MKLAELFSHGHAGLKVKRDAVPLTGNKSITYIGNHSIQMPFSSPSMTGDSNTDAQMKIPNPRKIVRGKRLKKLTRTQWKKYWSAQGGDHGGETFWTDNPTSTPCSSCGY